MSGKLQIHFTTDMPQATVEVVSPDLQTVGRMWMGPGRSGDIDIPSENTFLRVHLASGEVVTLKDPGNFNRIIDRSLLDRELEPRSARARAYKSKSLEMSSSLDPRAPVPKSGPTSLGNLTIQLASSSGTVQSGHGDGASTMTIMPAPSMEPYDLSIDAPGHQLRVRLPGLLLYLVVHTESRADGRQVVTIGVRTTNPVADAVTGYLTRGDLYSASAMAGWADEAEDLVQGKVSDPFSAAAGAYLLLRLRSFDRLRTWARNLADWFPQISDGSIIWAWQQILTRGDETAIRDYFGRAVAGKLPVYSEGLRLLRDGLRMLGPVARGQADALNAATGEVLWNSPFTASLTRTSSASSTPIDFEIEYAGETGGL